MTTRKPAKKAATPRSRPAKKTTKTEHQGSPGLGVTGKFPAPSADSSSKK